MLGHVFTSSAQEHIEFSHQWNHSAYPVSLVDSITIPQMSVFNLYTKGQTDPMVVPANSLLFNSALPDTLTLIFHDDIVEVSNPHLEYLEVATQASNVHVRSNGKIPFVCAAKGTCSDGRLIIDADTTFTIVLSELRMSSKSGSVICLKQKQNTKFLLADGTTNTLNDAQLYNIADSTDISNACIYAKGSLTFMGKGTLNVHGNYRHAIASSKNITIEDGNLNILCTQKDGIHCDKYKQKGGTVKLCLANISTKGIKVKELFELKKGRIEGEATGDLKIEKGETSYCTHIKSDGFFNMEDGEIMLKHTGNGGRCISVDKQLTMTGGVLDLECLGDGGSYINVANEMDYYTPKCITVDDSLLIAGGNIHCVSTGLGGKGLVADKYLSIGKEGEQNGLFLRIETQGECIINNEDEDLRFGCPKGIKAGKELHIYSGDIAVNTAGMGGEGVECKGEMFIKGGTLECNTFDDGINVGHSIEISDGQVYCNSVDNDGIDSNGSITITGGIVASVNQKKPNESFDAEEGRVFLKGGTVFGIGSGPVDVAEAVYPCYSSPYDVSEEWMMSRGLILTEGKYVCVQKGDKVIMALHNDNQAFRSFITIMSSTFSENEPYTISEGECPLSPNHSYFDGRLMIGGEASNTIPVTDEYFQIIKKQ